jgi:glycine hydroxymethyltransferase
MFASSARPLLRHLRALGNQLWTYENSVINLIASDNAYPLAISNRPTYRGHMIQEGLLGHRPFAGAALHDTIEKMSQGVACGIFGADHANLQPHSCSQANQAVYHALLSPGDTVLALDFRAGGHLTHGLSVNFSGRTYRFAHYGITETGYIDYAAAQELALQQQPKLLVCGSSSYPREYDIRRLRVIADSVGATLMLDLSHEAGLIAGAALSNPVPDADVVTMSLDKTLRGPFGAVVLSRGHLAHRLDRGIHPGTQSSFPLRRLTDATHALILTQSAAFQRYASRVIANAKVLEQCFRQGDVPMVTGGTDKHYVVLDVRKRFGISGVHAERALESIGVLTNRQTLPHDPTKRADEAGGLRLGTAWATSRGYRADDFEEIGAILVTALSSASVKAQRVQRALVRHLVSKTRKGDVWR